MTTREARLAVATALLALAGAGIAGYLAYARATSSPIMCPTSGCEVVEHSSYAVVLGIPVAYLGVAGYASVAVTVWWRRINGLLVVAVFGVSLFLLLAQLLAIHAICTWCVTSDCVAAALMLVRFGPAAVRKRKLLRSRSTSTSGSSVSMRS